MAPTSLFVFALCFEHVFAAMSSEEAEIINRRNNHNYGYAFYGFWAAIVFFGMLNRLFQSVESRNIKHTVTDSEGQSTPAPARQSTTLGHWTRTYLTTPPAFGKRHAQLSYWCTIPTRIEFAVIVAYWILTIVLVGVGYEFYPVKASSTSLAGAGMDAQRWKTFANRCAVLTLSNLPVLWVFAGRNNIFLWATGWSFQTFNIFHRHIARVTILLTIGHAAAYTHLSLTTTLKNGSSLWSSALTQDWFIWGIVGATSVGAFWLASASWIRRKSYEVFLVLHISLGILVIYSSFRHTSKVGGAFNNYLWSVVGIWAIDRSLRLVRLVACNLHVTRGKDFIRTTSTTAAYDEKSDVIRVQVETPGLALFGPTPGQYCYIYQPTSFRFYENHPFTVGAWTGAGGDVPPSPGSSVSSPASSVEKDSRMDSVAVALTKSLSSHKKQHAGTQQQLPTLTDKALVFWIRPYDGWTRRLRDQCMKSPSHICHPLLLLEGPYGQSQRLHKFNSVVFIVGGTGISAVLPYIKDHAHRSYNGSSRVTDMKLVWASRKASFVQSVYDSELGSILPRSDVKLDVYLTNEVSSDTNATQEETKDDPTSSPSSVLTMGSRHGRPDLDAVVASTVQELRPSDRCAFFVCGPAEMADDARAAVHAAMKKGSRNIEYFEDSFGW